MYGAYALPPTAKAGGLPRCYRCDTASGARTTRDLDRIHSDAYAEKKELPFYDADKHDTLTKQEQVEMHEAWGEYRENLQAASKLQDESDASRP